MARNPVVSSTERDNKSRNRDKQPENGTDGFSARYASRTADLGLKDADVSRASGIPTSSLSRYRNGGSPRAEHIFPLADALRCTARWLIAGTAGGAQLELVNEAEWVELPEYDLRDMDDAGKGKEIARTPFRRDWLNRNFLTDRRMWMAKSPADYEPLDISEGELLIFRDTAIEELAHGHLVLWKVDLHFVVARFSLFDGGRDAGRPGENYIPSELVGPEPSTMLGSQEGKSQMGRFFPIGRIVGRPLSPIR